MNIHPKDILAKVDHTLLKVNATWPQIETLCSEAITYQTASVCFAPSYVAKARQAYPTLNLCTVIGFPWGYTTSATKIYEIQDALANGADELDLVINITHVKNGHFTAVQKELEKAKDIAGNHILKVIIETCALTRTEKIRLCQIVTDVGADYIKTSTGFGQAGATRDDVLLFKEHIGPHVKIKAAGGIRTIAALEEFIHLGCARIGASNAVALLGPDTHI